MRFERVCLESLGYTLPDQAVTSEELESWLSPAYERLRLPAGRLELMTGIRERRFWAPNTLPSGPSSSSVVQALAAAEVSPKDVGLLIHASVCRDYLEPATASVVHSRCGLAPSCLLYDVSNACLGFLNGLIQAASMIELGHVRTAVVVATEGSRQLVENTVSRLNEDATLSRDDMKLAFASLTIGSASVAAVLTHRDDSRSQSVLLGGRAECDTTGAGLCHSGRDEAAAGGMTPWMRTDSETLMHAGVALGNRAFGPFLDGMGWTRNDLHKTICHQVGLGHRKLMLAALGLPSERDYTTVEVLGNTGSAALPITMAFAAERGFLSPKDHLALLGIGSGINTIMLGVDWQEARVLGCSEGASTDLVGAAGRA